jgi:hypothetical protein
MTSHPSPVAETEDAVRTGSSRLRKRIEGPRAGPADLRVADGGDDQDRPVVGGAFGVVRGRSAVRLEAEARRRHRAGRIGCPSSKEGRQEPFPSKLTVRVRSPSPAPPGDVAGHRSQVSRDIAGTVAVWRSGDPAVAEGPSPIWSFAGWACGRPNRDAPSHERSGPTVRRRRPGRRSPSSGRCCPAGC